MAPIDGSSVTSGARSHFIPPDLSYAYAVHEKWRLGDFRLLLQKRLAFSALTLLVGWQEENSACKKLSSMMLCGYLSGVRCRFAYGPAYATATHYLLLQ